MKKKLNKEKAIDEVANMLKAEEKAIDEVANILKAEEKAIDEVANIPKTEDNEILKCMEVLQFLIGQNHKIRLEELKSENLKDDEQKFYILFVDNTEINYRFDFGILNAIFNYRDFIKHIIYKQIPNKYYSNLYAEWSYIDEKEEYAEQYGYNQTLWELIKTMDIDAIIVNSKLKPLFETLCGYNEADNPNIKYNNKNINIKFTESNKDENIIYCYNSKQLQRKPVNLTLRDLELVSGLYGSGTIGSTPFKRIEITNIDDGVFGINHNLVRMKNPSKIVLYLNPEADLEYDLEIMKFNKNFSGIEHIDFVKPKSKYSYHSKLLSDFKKESSSNADNENIVEDTNI